MKTMPALKNLSASDMQTLTDLVTNNAGGMVRVLEHLFDVCPQSFIDAADEILDEARA